MNTLDGEALFGSSSEAIIRGQEVKRARGEPIGKRARAVQRA